MKKNRIIIVVILLILISGYFLKKEWDKKKLIETEGPRIEKYLKYNFKDIETVQFTKVIINPTGVPHIKGYFNNEENTFDAGIYSEHFEGALDFTGFITPKHQFDDETEKNVSEIEEEEAQKNK
ncbi:DUF1433 domain-containing protein [Isobaculum melis]|uniref:DUF1433 domain-containing protein n=1 Tax=Isobaculum melis TaxID=142588 RepID=A0A1H9TJW6_9LACT|nr:DUF1433 domain-containing protein [Isobaculum melis]SER97406.1 Protein of unknown function [Isobaculum melis]